MSQMMQFLINHGLPFVFAAVFVEQMGLALPALHWLLAAGALLTIGKFNLALGLLATVVACLSADTIWFYLGRYRGNQVVGLLRRISLEPDSCVASHPECIHQVWVACDPLKMREHPNLL